MPNVDRIAEVQLAYTIAALKQIIKNKGYLVSEGKIKTSNGEVAYVMGALREIDSAFDVWSALLRTDSCCNFLSRDEIIKSDVKLSRDSAEQFVQELEVYIDRLEERFTWNGRDGYGVGFHPNRRVWEVMCYTDAESSGWRFELRTMN